AEKEQPGDGQQPNYRGEETLVRHLIPPKEKRTQAQVNDRQQFGPVECMVPDAFLLLKRPQLPQGNAKPAADGDGRDDAEGLENVGPGGLNTDDQRDGKPPKEGRGTPHEPA